jgi:predicted regulator of Ras-like GTPase activity (Roadblock/LC7/MglB family)
MVHSAKGEYEKIMELNPQDDEAKSKLESAFWEKREAEVAEPEEPEKMEDKAVQVSFGEEKIEEPMATPPEVEIEEEPSAATGEPSRATFEEAIEESLTVEDEEAEDEEEEVFIPKAEVQENLEPGEEEEEPTEEEGAEEVDLLFGEENVDFPFDEETEEDQGFSLEEEVEKEEFRPSVGEQKLDLSVEDEEEEEAPLGTPLQDDEIEQALTAGLMLEKQQPRSDTPEERAAVASGLDALIRSFETIRKEHGAPPAQPAPAPKEEAASSLTALDRTLNDLLQKPGVKAALLIDPSGLVVESASSLRVDVEETAALISNVFSSSQKTMETLNLGKVDRVAVERGGNRVYITRAGDYMLMVETDSTMRLGLLMVMAKKTSRTIEELMS